MTENEMNNQAAQTMPSVDAFMAKWEWLILSRCRDEFRADLDAMLAAAPAASGGEASKFDCDDPTCGCKDPAFTEPMEALEFLSGRFKYAGVSHAVARSYARDIDAILAAQPSSAASGAHPDALPDGTLSKSTAKRVEALAAASVSEDAAFESWFSGEQGKAYDGMWSFARAAWMKRAALEQALTQQRGEVEDEDYHVIMSMGRLLAEIAVILKGAEPAGTAWSYHDLPDLVKSAVENAHDIASEMRAWAAVKMRDRGSSRRDKMMVEEWSKRLLALPEVAFPVKDFDIPGLSITKEEIRFAIRKVVADRAFIGQDFGDTTPQPSADAVRELVERWRSNGHPYVSDCADELESLLSAASGEKGVG